MQHLQKTGGWGPLWLTRLPTGSLSGAARILCGGSASAMEVLQSAEWTHPIRIPHELALTLHKRRSRQSPSCRARLTEHAPPIPFHPPRIAVILSSAVYLG